MKFMSCVKKIAKSVKQLLHYDDHNHLTVFDYEELAKTHKGHPETGRVKKGEEMKEGFINHFAPILDHIYDPYGLNEFEYYSSFGCRNDLDHLSGFVFKSSLKAPLGTCEIPSCHEPATHILWSWNGSRHVVSCSKHKAGNIQFKVSTQSYRNHIKGSRLIDDGDTFPEAINAIREATVAAFERIESNSRYAYHELSESCPWMKPVSFKRKTFTQGLNEARMERKRIIDIDRLTRDTIYAGYMEPSPGMGRYKHLTLTRS